MNSENKIIISLYDHLKNTPKKLKIVCGWDEVIQPCEPYALWKYLTEDKKFEEEFLKQLDFKWFMLIDFWGKKTDNEFSLGNKIGIEYSAYGSKLDTKHTGEGVKEAQPEIKNSPNFYQQAPFLTIAEDLLKLIKEGKVEKLIFLSAYDKRKFPNGDERKEKIIRETFGRLIHLGGLRKELGEKGGLNEMRIELIPFDSENKGESKVDWIKENASDFDIVIDDNPIICGNIECAGELWKKGKVVIAPHYPTIENQHHKDVILVKNQVSNLKIEDFIKQFVLEKNIKKERKNEEEKLNKNR